MGIYELTSDVKPDTPVLIQALAGWVDAGSAGTTTAAFLAGDGDVVARFDPDALFDYRSNRPILDFVDGEVKEIRFPEIVVRHGVISGKDLLVLTGLEPDMRWMEFSSAVAGMAADFGVTRLISVGAVPAAVPHTMESPVMMTASDKSLLEGQRVPPGLLRVPAAAVSVVDHQLAGRGFETVGFWAQVPHYVGEAYSPAVLALVGKIAAHLGLEVSTDPLRKEAQEQRTRLNAIVAERPEVQAYVERLESNAEAELGFSGDIADEVERFLKDVGGANPFND